MVANLGPPALAGMAMAPRVDVSETDSEIKIEVELPGVDEKDFQVVLSDGRLTIKGEKKQEKEEKKDYYLVERPYGSFARTVAMAEPAHRRGAASRTQMPALLKGLIFGPNGRPMSPSHTRRRGRALGRRWRAFVATQLDLLQDWLVCAIEVCGQQHEGV